MQNKRKAGIREIRSIRAVRVEKGALRESFAHTLGVAAAAARGGRGRGRGARTPTRTVADGL